MFRKSHHYLLGRRILKFCYILNAPLCWNLLVVLFLLSIWLLLRVSCHSIVPLSLILIKRLIASLKHYKRILENCQQLILSNLDVCSSVIWRVGRKTKDLVVYVKVNWLPLTNIWVQSSPKLTSTLFVSLSYAWNRSLDRDLFYGVPSAIHILHNSLLQRTMTKMSIPSGQSRILQHMRIKWDLVLG